MPQRVLAGGDTHITGLVAHAAKAVSVPEKPFLTPLAARRIVVQRALRILKKPAEALQLRQAPPCSVGQEKLPSMILLLRGRRYALRIPVPSGAVLSSYEEPLPASPVLCSGQTGATVTGYFSSSMALS